MKDIEAQVGIGTKKIKFSNGKIKKLILELKRENIDGYIIQKMMNSSENMYLTIMID